MSVVRFGLVKSYVCVLFIQLPMVTSNVWINPRMYEKIFQLFCNFITVIVEIANVALINKRECNRGFMHLL